MFYKVYILIFCECIEARLLFKFFIKNIKLRSEQERDQKKTTTKKQCHTFTNISKKLTCEFEVGELGEVSSTV